MTKPDWAERAVAKLDTFQKGGLPVCLVEEVVWLLRTERRRVVRKVNKLRGDISRGLRPYGTYPVNPHSYREACDDLLAALRRGR